MKVEITKCDICGAEARNEVTSEPGSIYHVERKATAYTISDLKSRLRVYIFPKRLPLNKGEILEPIDFCYECWNSKVPPLLTELFKRLSIR